LGSRWKTSAFHSACVFLGRGRSVNRERLKVRDLDRMQSAFEHDDLTAALK